MLELPETYAVLHALPIGRVEDLALKPRYTLYLTTYFAARPADFWRRLYPYEYAFTYNPPRRVAQGEWRGEIVGLLPYEAADYDLLPWVERGKLLWLGPDLELSSSPRAFPYDEIEGREGRWCLEKESRRREGRQVRMTVCRQLRSLPLEYAVPPERGVPLRDHFEQQEAGRQTARRIRSPKDDKRW